ncbi:hypothetical protein BO82DRAFT_361425 [Aspergillus uvarum CBS 121591]|uniref:Uncharacterized protein n=1 Tax=Aspergillus uvarum CBS 121591 TaxID=1448315 RepID=A0A319D4R4_9EURO|nr:hypothetical protein BO82DRAFT_361425 [Aspergillus uvarum CBS 121591]PYH86043.1 hypothetical protein BO82DRAFT_361425 [Aspergillus uvarum CBS 121591]
MNATEGEEVAAVFTGRHSGSVVVVMLPSVSIKDRVRLLLQMVADRPAPPDRGMESPDLVVILSPPSPSSALPPRGYGPLAIAKGTSSAHSGQGDSVGMYTVVVLEPIRGLHLRSNVLSFTHLRLLYQVTYFVSYDRVDPGEDRQAHCSHRHSPSNPDNVEYGMCLVPGAWCLKEPRNSNNSRHNSNNHPSTVQATLH